MFKIEDAPIKISDGNYSGKYPKASEFLDSGIPFLSGYNIVNGVVDEKNCKFISEELHKELKKGHVETGDVLITTRGNIGNTAIVPSRLNDVNINAQLVLLRPEKEQIDSNYLKHIFSSPDLKRQISIGLTGSALKQLPIRSLKELEIPLPPLDEQKRIAAILDKADAIRRKRQQAIELADDFLRSLFLDMFGDPVTNPKGFKKAAITELSDVITGYAFKSAEYVQDGENSVRLCRGANTLTGYFEWKDTAYWDRDKLKGIENYIINSGDVILAMDRPWISSGLKVCVFPENQRTTYLVQRVARIRPKQAIYTDYLYSCILSSAFEKHCCPTETTVPHISPVELKNFEVLVPDEKLVQKYHDVVFKVRSSMLAMEESLLEANSAFNSLSQKAFAGEL
nr:restriction endonuclease subunit S [Pseudoalteromonas distincta]